MTDVKCPWDRCKHLEGGVCQLGEINLTYHCCEELGDEEFMKCKEFEQK